MNLKRLFENENSVSYFDSDNSLANRDMNVLMTNFAHLSGGYQLNSAADDAAGLGISKSIEAQTRSFAVAERNTNDSILVVGGAGNDILASNIIIRERELAVQSANGGLLEASAPLVDLQIAPNQADLTVTDKVGPLFVDIVGYPHGASAPPAPAVAKLSTLRVWTSPDLPFAGLESLIHAEVLNSGTADTMVQPSFMIGGLAIQPASSSSILAGKSAIISTNFTFPTPGDVAVEFPAGSGASTTIRVAPRPTVSDTAPNVTIDGPDGIQAIVTGFGRDLSLGTDVTWLAGVSASDFAFAENPSAIAVNARWNGSFSMDASTLTLKLRDGSISSGHWLALGYRVKLVGAVFSDPPPTSEDTPTERTFTLWNNGAQSVIPEQELIVPLAKP